MKPIRAEQLVQLAAEKPGPPAEMIFGEWYPALRADSLRLKDTAVTMLLGIPMLLGRKSDGSLFACAICARTVGFRFRLAGSMARPCSASITAGALSLAAGGARRFLR